MTGARSTLARVQQAARATVSAEALLQPFNTLKEEQGDTWETIVRQRMRELELTPAEEDGTLLEALPDAYRGRVAAYSDARNGQELAAEEAAYLFGLIVGLAMTTGLTGHRR